MADNRHNNTVDVDVVRRLRERAPLRVHRDGVLFGVQLTGTFFATAGVTLVADARVSTGQVVARGLGVALECAFRALVDI